MTSRLGAAAVAAVFVVTTGITAMEAHQLAAHTSAGEPTIAPQPVGLALEVGEAADHSRGQVQHDHHEGHGGGHHASRGAPSASGEHAAHAGTSVGSEGADHSEHGSAAACTCVGPCASGAPPTLADGRVASFWLGETAPFCGVPTDARIIHQDPRSYLLPFSNPPPSRV